MGKSAQKVGAIIVVTTIAIAAFVAGRVSTNFQPIGDVAFERACLEGNEFEFRDKIKAEFKQIQQEWEAEHSRYKWPVHAAVYRSFEPVNLEAYMEKVAVTREDYAAFIERRIDCARQAAAQR